MALAQVERESAAQGEGCLGKARDDEPVFILRAQDKLAPGVVELWARWLRDEARKATDFHAGQRAAIIQKADDADVLARSMRVWQENNWSKLPD